MSEILVIEDESVLGRNLARALESEGHSVRVYGSGEEGIAGARSALPDLVLLDLRLPDGSGLDFLEKIRGVGDQISVIMMTAYGSVTDAVEAMRRGAVDYVQKPLDIDELRLLVGRVLVQKRRDRELDFLIGQDDLRNF